MAGIVTWAGLDVHARLTHAAAIDIATGEMVRARFGPGIEEPVAWLQGLRGPVRACYEAGPTGFGHYRAAAAGSDRAHCRERREDQGDEIDGALEAADWLWAHQRHRPLG
jgi:hypothetical protein